jgi:hypothetical protein
MGDGDNGMGDEIGLDAAFRHLAHRRIEQERHVVVDQRHHRDRSTQPRDRRIALDRNHALAAPMPLDGGIGELARAHQGAVAIGGDVFAGSAVEQHAGQPFCRRRSVGRRLMRLGRLRRAGHGFPPGAFFLG